MNLRSIGTYALGAGVLALTVLNAHAKVRAKGPSISATQVPAEMTKGRLSTAESSPGDTVVLTLKNDLKSNGEVVLKKGTSIGGVVRNVKREQSLSMVELEWMSPTQQGRIPRSLSITLQSVTQLTPMNQPQRGGAAVERFTPGGRL